MVSHEEPVVHNYLWPSLICSALCTFAYGQQSGVYSGPQPGEKVTKLEVVDAFQAKAESYDAVARIGSNPSILIIIHDMLNNKSDEPSLGLAYVLSHYAASREDTDLQRSVVFLSDDIQAMRNFLAKIRRALPKKDTPIVISTDGLEGPGAWGLNRNLRMTVVVLDGDQVVANFALQQPSVTVDAPRVLAEVVKMIGGEVPKLQDLDFPYYIGKPPMSDK
jgi:hypothetical protein